MRLSSLLLEPHWAWRLSALLSTAPAVAILMVRGEMFSSGHWLRLCLYPAAFAVCWGGLHRQRSTSADAGRWSLIGVLLFLVSAAYLHHEQWWGGSPMTSDLKAAFILSLMALCLNSAGLLVPTVRALLREPGHRAMNLNLTLGVILLTSATLPSVLPSWEFEPRGLINRLAILDDQAFIGIALIMASRLTELLRRHDPLGDARRGLMVLWPLLAAGYLVSVTVSRWIWSYEVWVVKVQYVLDVKIRKAVIGIWPPLAWLAMLSLAPAAHRTARDLISRRPPPSRPSSS